MDEKPHYGPGKNPNSLANLKRGNRFGPGDDPVKRLGRENARRNQAQWKTISTIITTELDKEDGKLKELLGKRVLKMALEGNLAAIQYVVKLIGEEPAEKVDITTADFSALDRAMEAMDIPAGSRDAP